jgi:plastocyanin
MRSLFAATLAISFICLPALAADDDKWSTVKGKVVFDDSKQKIPAREFPPAAKGKDLPKCAAQDKEFLTEDWVVDPKTKAVRDVFVWLAPEPTAAEWKQIKEGKLKKFPSFKEEQLHPDLKAAEPKTVEMDQPCCRFIPHVLAVRVGQAVVVKNSASFAHNAHWYSQNNGESNPLLGEGKEAQFPVREWEKAEVRVLCDIHPWMSATIRVFDHPYFAVTNAAGEYEIKNAPVGKGRIFVWHREGGYSGKAEGRQGFELTTTAKVTEVKEYSVTLDDKTK